jgi:hypothetical protein
MFHVINGVGTIQCSHPERRDATASCKAANKVLRENYRRLKQPIPGNLLYFVKETP